MREKRIYCSFRRTMMAMGMTLLLTTAVVVQSPASNSGEISAPQATQEVSGVVSDANGPLPGVTVMVKGTSVGAATDIDGKYSVAAAPGAVLVFSFMGYKTQEVTVGNQTTINVVLKEDVQLMEEVVVVGYGTQKKVNLTGSIASVGQDELKDRVNTDVLKAVQGTVPGVTIISRPGSDAVINFRGRGNLGTSTPLYVIDGAIADAEFFSSLDPSTIESISFLKDAASSAIYGSRAAYGVVLVKTKGGRKGDMKVTYNGYMGFKVDTYRPDVVDSWEYATLYNEAIRNANPNNQPKYTQEEIQKFRDGSDPDRYPNTNWYDEVLNDMAVTTQHQLNFQGGSENIRYFVGMGYVYDESLTPGAHSDRFNLSGNVSADIKPWLTLNTNVKYIYRQYEREGAPALMTCLTIPVTYAAKQSDGSWGTVLGGTQAPAEYIKKNPLRNLEGGDWLEEHRKNSMIDLGFDIKPVKGLVLTGQFVYKGWDYKKKTYTASWDNVNSFLTGREIAGSGRDENKMEYDWQTTSRLLYNGLAKYNWNNDVHDLSILAGMSYEHYKWNQSKSWRKGFPNNNMTDMNGGSSADVNTYAEGGATENKMLSYFGRINYSLFGKYLLEANLRADASSRFHKDERWGIFPSFSAGWRISQENFMKDIHWVNNLKLRASWGQLGNINNVGDYDYLPAYGMGNNYNFEDKIVNGMVENKPANATLSWETVTITDVGVDFDIFDGMLSVVADWYIKNTTDILLGYNVPVEVGIPNDADHRPSQNLGKVENKGIEFSFTHRNKIGQVSYTVGGNFSKNWNKVKNLGDSDPMYKDPWIKKVGKPIGTFYGLKADGLLTQADIDNGTYISDGTTPQAGDIKYVDVHKDGVLNGDDRTFIGCDVPDITYGANISVQYKGVELSVMGQGVSGTKVKFSEEQAWAFFEDASPRKWHLKRWTEANPNPKAIYPRIYLKGDKHQNYNQKFSDYWLFDSDYFRIKNITLGYSFPKAWMDRCFLDSAKIFFTAENPFTIRADKRMKDFDPEASSGRGVGALGLRTFAFGVNVSF